MTVVRDGHNTGRPTKKQQRARVKAAKIELAPPGANPYLAPFVPREPGLGAVSWNKGQQKRRYLIGLLSQKTPLGDALAAVGYTRRSYQDIRDKDLNFAAACDYARREGKGTLSGESFVGFRKRYFGFDSYYHHCQIIDAIESAGDMSVTMILVAPFFGKTTTICDWINWKIALDPNVRIAYVSESDGFAKKQLGRISRRMTDPDLAGDYIATFGPFKDEGRTGKPWSATHLTVLKANHDEADFTLETKGIGSHVYGARFDIIVFDDIQSIGNLNQTDKLLASIRQDFLSRPGRTGKVVIVGTRVDVGDVYERMLDEGIIDKLVQLPATNPVEVPCPEALPLCNLGHADCCGLHWADGSVVPHEASMSPELWDNHSLARRRRQVGNVTWLRSYQQRPQAAGSATFSPEMIEAAKDSARLIGETTAGTIGLSLDPAMGGQMSLMSFGLLPDRIELTDLVTAEGLTRTEQMLFHVEQFVSLYKPKLLVVESDTMQKGLARDDRLREMASKHGFLVIEHRTAGQKSDAVLGVAMMASGFSRGEIRIPWGDANAQRRMAVFVEELAAWRPQIATRKLKQDTVMSIWFMWKYWSEVRATLLDGVENQFTRTGIIDAYKRVGSSQLRMQKRKVS